MQQDAWYRYFQCYEPYSSGPSQLITLIPKVTYEKMGALTPSVILSICNPAKSVILLMFA